MCAVILQKMRLNVHKLLKMLQEKQKKKTLILEMDLRKLGQHSFLLERSVLKKVFIVACRSFG